MLVDSEGCFVVAQLENLMRERGDHAAQQVELKLMLFSSVKGFANQLHDSVDVRAVGLDCFLMLDESLQRFYDAVLVCHSVSVWVWVRGERTDRCDDAPRRNRIGCRTLVPVLLFRPLEGRNAIQ